MRTPIKFLAKFLFILCLAFPSFAGAQLLTGFDTAPPVIEDTPSPESPQERPPEEILEPQAPLTRAEEIPAPVLLAEAPPRSVVQQPVGYRPVMTGDFGTDVYVPMAAQDDESAPVDLQANSMSRDEEQDLVTAEGDVMIVQAGRILRADQVDYNVGTDTVHAKGNVVLNEETGNIHLSDDVTYQNKLENGTVNNLQSFLADGSRFKAVSGERKGGTVTVMKDAFYTPCEMCKNEPEKPPVWDLVASKMTHDQEEHRVSYRNARLEFMGVPVAYTPYFSHPDGTVKQKSGFLTPSAGYKSSLGMFLDNRYYWGIAPDQDATVGLRVMTEELPLLTGEYRKRWEDASLKLSGGITDSGRKDRTVGQVVAADRELRGHVFANGRWDMNDKWRSGVNINWTSDDQYMRQYDFTDEDVLENEVYAERFSGRSYASGRVITYHDIRVRDQPIDQPDVLPEIIASFKGEPGDIPLLKGQWTIDTSMLGLMRDGSDQDMNRFSTGLGWERRLVSDYGFLTSVEANARADFYHINDKTTATPASGLATSAFATRFFPQLHMKTSYPMARAYENMQAKIEPVLALTLAPKISDPNKIPNEDSIDAQIDASNLLEANRFPGLDRVEDQSRLTYGMRAGLFGYGGSYGDVFFGQSYRLSNDNNPFAVGSGLNNQSSDYVGQISGRFANTYNLDYRFQLDSDNFGSQRHEVDAWADWNRLRLSTRYLFARGLGGTSLSDSREQVRGDAQYYLTKEWRVRGGATHDLGVNEGLRQAYTGIDYLGQCIFVSLTGEKNYTTDASGDSGTEVLLRVGLKNLGEFEESSLRPAVETE